MRAEEKILVKELKKRNKAVFESIFREYYSLLKSFAFRFVPDEQKCEDFIQDLFSYIWKNADQLYFKTSFKAYLIQSVKNRCLNYLRDLKIQDKHQLLYVESMLSLGNDELIENEDLFQKVSEAISGLPPEIAKVLLLKYFEGKKVNEIAQLKDMSPNTVKKRLQKAKELLRKKLLAYMFFV